MACGHDPGTCRREHIARRLDDAEADGGDFEACCPICGHDSFRISKPDRSRKYRHIWACACKGCKCTAGTLRIALLKRNISAECLGPYDGPSIRQINPDVARAVDRTIDDIFALPHIKPSEMRLMLAEARGWTIPTSFREFVKFAKSIGISPTRAKDLAPRWCRPSDCHPQTRGVVVDTSRTTDPAGLVKPPSSETHERSKTDHAEVRNGPSSAVDRSETDLRTPGDKKNATYMPAA